MLPALSLRWSLNYAQAGRLFTVQLLASTLAVMLSGIVASRFGFRFAICPGLFAMAVGIAALPFCSYLPGLVFIAIYGLGAGLAVPAANLAVAEENPSHRSAELSRLNFFWSLGAVACPFLVAAAEAIHRTRLFLLIVSAFMMVVAAVIIAIPSDGTERTATLTSESRPPIEWSKRSLLILVGIFFLYVGTEIGFGGWIATFANGLKKVTPSLAVMSPSFFYLALMLGRWAAPFVLRHVDEIKVARFGVAIACAGMIGMIGSNTVIGIVVSGIVAGFGLSAVFPITISLLSGRFGVSASRLGSLMFTLSNLGGACLPWLVGYSSKRFGNPRAGLVAPLISGVLIYVLFSNWNSAPIKESETAMN
jgi:MFS transporter, FHS family, glucose/mannose:H+ symporter